MIPADPRRRWIVLALIGVCFVISGALLAGCGDADEITEATGDSSTIMAARLTRLESNQQEFIVRGARSNRPANADFSIWARMTRIPCAGRYRLSAASENTANGNSWSYVAMVTLGRSSIRPPSARCGIPLLPQSERVSVRLIRDHKQDLVALHSGRRGLASGTLSVSGMPDCAHGDRLKAMLELGSAGREYRFDVRVRTVELRLQGEPIQRQRCSGRRVVSP